MFEAFVKKVDYDNLAFDWTNHNLKSAICATRDDMKLAKAEWARQPLGIIGSLGVAVIWYTDTCTERTLALAGSARECGVTRILRRICTDFYLKKAVFIVLQAIGLMELQVLSTLQNTTAGLV